MKECYSCNEVKSLDDFYAHKEMTDGRLNICKVCHSSRAKIRHHELATQGRASHQILRQKALEIMGGKCVRCGFSDPRALQFDHINGGGSAERKEPGYSRRQVERKIVSGLTEEYQILCANCNVIKVIEDKEYYSPYNCSDK